MLVKGSKVLLEWLMVKELALGQDAKILMAKHLPEYQDKRIRLLFGPVFGHTLCPQPPPWPFPPLSESQNSLWSTSLSDWWVYVYCFRMHHMSRYLYQN